MLEQHTKTLAALVLEEKQLKVKIEEAKGLIVDELKAKDLSSFKTDYGTFTIGTRRSWTYTPAVKKMEEKLKLKKVEEEEKGVAQVKVSEFLTVRV